MPAEDSITNLPEDSDEESPDSVPSSPGNVSVSSEHDFPKMGIYSPSTDDQFSVPEERASEPHVVGTSLLTAVSDVQEAKCYFPEAEYAVSSVGDISSNQYYTVATTRPYSISQSSVSPSPTLMSPAYAAVYNPTASFPSPAESLLANNGVYAMNAACMSPSYVSPYAPGKQYTWPPSTNGYGVFAGPHELMPTAGYPYQPVGYSRPTTGYPGYLSTASN